MRVTFVAALLAVLLPLAGPATPAAAAVNYEGPEWMARLGVIGDSLTSSSVDWARAAIRSYWWRDAIVGKAGFTVEDMRTDIRTLAADRPEAMVIALGTNDSIKLEFGTSSWSFIQTQIRGALNDVQNSGVPCVVWVGVNEVSGRPGPDAWAKQFNDEVRTQLAARGIGSMADWTSAALGHPEFFTDLVHMTEIGKQVFWNIIADRTQDCSHNPRGSFDGASAGMGVRVAGWTYDPDTTGANTVHVYVDGTLRAVLPANTSRPDVAAAFPWVSTRHGFDSTLAVEGGVHNVCVFAMNVGPYGFTNPVLGCRTVIVDGSPQGFLDVATGDVASARLQGWSIDPDTVGSIDVHVYVDGVFEMAAPANRHRSDLAAAFPAYGGAHGFDVDVDGLSRGLHQACAYGINAASTAGGNRLLGCRTFSVSMGADPIGSMDGISVIPAGIRLQGWAIDADTTASITVRVRIDGVSVGVFPAAISRPDVGNAFPGFGSLHGYDVIVPSPGPGTHEVCMYAINATGTPGVDTELRCVQASNLV